MPETKPARGIDPRGPRFVAGITAVLLIVDVFLGLVVPVGEGFLGRILNPAFLLLLVIALLFLWGVASPRTAPWGVLYRRAVQQRLAPPSELEDPRPPRFAQGIGLFVTGVGVILALLGVPLAVPVAAGMAFIAAFLNSAFGYCLGCELYLLLQRAGVIGRRKDAAAA